MEERTADRTAARMVLRDRMIGVMGLSENTSDAGLVVKDMIAGIFSGIACFAFVVAHLRSRGKPSTFRWIRPDGYLCRSGAKKQENCAKSSGVPGGFKGWIGMNKNPLFPDAGPVSGGGSC